MSLSKKPKKQWLLAILVATGLGTVLLYPRLFYSKTIYHEISGKVIYEWKWGKLKYIKADTNQDGKIDFRSRLEDEKFPEEFWEDLDHDGYFEVHTIMKYGEPYRVEVDLDGDGQAEELYLEREARKYFKRRGGRVALPPADE